MYIIIRSCGERTEQKCIDLVSRHGNHIVIRERPFGESIRQTYIKALDIGQKWMPVIDADVQLYDGTISKGIEELESKGQNSFCFDGATDDKILMMRRRAGIHIYRTAYLEKALKYIDNNHIKPESNVRRTMAEKHGLQTYTSNMSFGNHDHDQYYCDLWRKSVLQTRKLARMIKNRPAKWKTLSKTDKDYLVIYNAHMFGKKYTGNMIIDKDYDFEAKENIKKMRLKEKGELI